MPDETEDLLDMLASATADMDQAQATINEARIIFKDDVDFQKKLDKFQEDLDAKRDRAAIANEFLKRR